MDSLSALLLWPTLSEYPEHGGSGCGEGASPEVGCDPVTGGPAGRPSQPAPFGTAVAPKPGVSVGLTGERITYPLRALGTRAGEASVTTYEVKAAVQMDGPGKPQLASSRGFYSEAWLPAQIMEVKEPQAGAGAGTDHDVTEGKGGLCCVLGY